MARDKDEDSGRPFIEINHPAPGDVEAFEESASGSGEDLHPDRVSIVFR